jgi:hypothetical protein
MTDRMWIVVQFRFMVYGSWFWVWGSDLKGSIRLLVLVGDDDAPVKATFQALGFRKRDKEGRMEKGSLELGMRVGKGLKLREEGTGGGVARGGGSR